MFLVLFGLCKVLQLRLHFEYSFEHRCAAVQFAFCSLFRVSFFHILMLALQSSHYENLPIQIYRKISPPKTENFQIKIDIFHISAQNIECGYSLEPPRRGGSNEYPNSMFLSRNKKNNVYPCKPQFYYIKVGFKCVKII